MSRRRHLRRWISAVLVLGLFGVALVVVFQVVNSVRNEGPDMCVADVGGQTSSLVPSQAGYAALISGVSVRDGLPPRAATIALATALQESHLRNLDFGDAAGPDSRGLFQQRPSQGWGTEAQIMDPYYSTETFYKALQKVPDYQLMKVTEAAQTVQRSAHPEAYGNHEGDARILASSLTGQSPASFTCSLSAPTESGTTPVVQNALTSTFGALGATASGREIRVPVSGSKGWSVAAWAVANAKDLNITRVDFDQYSWLRETRAGWKTTQGASGAFVVITVSAGPGG